MDDAEKHEASIIKINNDIEFCQGERNSTLGNID